MKETLRLEDLVQILKKKAAWIVLTTVAGIGLAAGVTFFLITPKYDSTAQLIAQNQEAEGSSGNLQNDINGNVLMINTYKDMIKSDLVIDAVQKKLQDEYQYVYSNSGLKNSLEVEQAQNSQMFQITATSSEPRKAALIANITAITFQEKAEEVLAVSKVTITSEAGVSAKAVFPNNQLNLLIGSVVGMLIGVGLAFLIELVDKTMKDERFIVETLGLPVLGQVSEINPKELIRSRRIVVTTREDNKPTWEPQRSTRKRRRI
ncbi:YveK family protein [Enterococcus avium]|uniref:YveK family protein n=1 Tax=Enterococcus avium TaxID=33945 RepID=UPI00379C759F